MTWLQKQIQLEPRRRGCHLTTQEIVVALPELARVRTGLLHVFIQHTSASLTINENGFHRRARPDETGDWRPGLNG